MSEITTSLRWVIRTTILALPGLVMLGGGIRSPLPPATQYSRLSEFLYQQVYPDELWSLVVCAVLSTLPGIGFYAGAEYLEEVTFWRIPVTATTPACIWRAVGLIVAVVVAVLVGL